MSTGTHGGSGRGIWVRDTTDSMWGDITSVTLCPNASTVSMCDRASTSQWSNLPTWPRGHPQNQQKPGQVAYVPPCLGFE